MSDKTKGLIIPPLTIFLIVIFGAIYTITVTNSSDGWAALGALVMTMMAIALAIIIMLGVGIYYHYKKKSVLGIAMFKGVALTLLALFVFGILSAL